MNQTETLPEPTARKLHVSTCIFFTLALLFFVLLNVPGQLVMGPHIFSNGQYGPHFNSDEHCIHGWPFIYLHREAVNIGPTWGDWRLSIWRLAEGVERFSLIRLVTDAFLGLGISLFAGYLFEIWRRRHRRLLQFHLIDLFFFVTITSIGSAIYALHLSQYRAEQTTLRAIENMKTDVQWGGNITERIEYQHGGPSWLRQLIGDRPLRVFDRVVAIDVADENLDYAINLLHLKKFPLLSQSVTAV